MVFDVEVRQDGWRWGFGERLDVGGAELGGDAVVGEEFGQSVAGAEVAETTDIWISGCGCGGGGYRAGDQGGGDTRGCSGCGGVS